VDNAIDATRGASGDVKEVEVELLQEDSTLFITVADSGPGVTPGFVDEMFVEGTTTKPDSGIPGGRGIGLALSRQLSRGLVGALPGFTVVDTATTLAAARKVGPVDLALVDVYLPDGSGVDFVRELHGDAMMLTAATETRTVRAALAAGAWGYLVKPFQPTEL